MQQIVLDKRQFTMRIDKDSLDSPTNDGEEIESSLSMYEERHP